MSADLRVQPHLRAALVLLAAGSGSRVGHELNKVFLPLAGRRVFTWSLRWASHVEAINSMVLVVAERDRDLAMATLRREAPDTKTRLVIGGDTRHESEWKALSALADDIRAGEIDVVVIHDAARPLAGPALYDSVISAAAEHGGAIPVRPQSSVIPLNGSAAVGSVVAVQTPQAFKAQPLLTAYEAAHSNGFVGTDTASCIERFSNEVVRCVPSSAHNIKITYPEDLFLAEHLLARSHWDLTSEATRT